MAFVLQNWGQVSGTANTSTVYRPDGTVGAVQSSPNVFSYYTQADTIATVSADNYFSRVAQGVKPSDFILARCSDGEIILTVLDMNVINNPPTISTSEIFNPTEPPIFTNTVNLNPSDVVQLRDIPFRLVPGIPGRIIVPFSFAFRLAFTTTAYNVNTDQPMGIYYTTTSNPIINAIDPQAFLQSVNNATMLAAPDNPNTLTFSTTQATGAPLLLVNSGVGNYGGGNSSVTITTAYYLITP